MTRFELMKEWSAGFAAGIVAGTGWDYSQNEHWRAGYQAGYKTRPTKNRLLDDYLVSIGTEPQAEIRLANEGK